MNMRKAPRPLDYESVRALVWADKKTEAQNIKNATYH
jgi:hypothetical protein